MRSLCNYNSGSVNSDWPVCILVYVLYYTSDFVKVFIVFYPN